MARLKYFNQVTKSWDYADTSVIGGGSGEVTKEYVDVRDEAILTSAKEYADTTTLSSAKSYTDTEIGKVELKIVTNANSIATNKGNITKNTNAISQINTTLANKVGNTKDVTNLWSGTQDEYDSIPSKSPTTIYFILDVPIKTAKNSGKLLYDGFKE